MPTSKEFREARYTVLMRTVKKQHGALLDRSYSRLHKPLTATCQQGHRFKIKAKDILRGIWCQECRPLSRQTEYLAAAQTAARKHGGKCLSSKYENARTKLNWQCKLGHRWQASLDNVANKNSWCPTCNFASISERKKKWWRKESAVAKKSSKPRAKK